MSTTQQQDSEPTTQQEYLEKAKQKVNRGSDKYARMVIFVWFSDMDLPPPFLVNENPDAQPTFCADCSSGADPVLAEFHWDLFGSICSWCSLARFSEDGANPRVSDEAERRGQ